MGDTWRLRRRDHRRQLWLSFATITAVSCILVATSAVGLNPSQQLSGKATQQLKGIAHGSSSGRVESTQSQLSGPGSSPPRCISKCGRCKPCRPVHVAIHPGVSIPLEYYPEAWRCKCRDKLYMP